MSSLKPLDASQLSPAMAALIEQPGSDRDHLTGLHMFAHKQEVFAPIWAAYIDLLEHGKLERSLKELVRAKIAQNNDCSSYASKSVPRRALPLGQAAPESTDEKLAAVGCYEVSTHLSGREKLALRFAEKLGIEPEGLDDEFFALLRQEFSDAEIVELGHVIAVGIGFERFLSVWEPRVCALSP